ncbi:hypothetical protein QMP26_10140 [Enterocloster clostridioformis]|uniref:hypothetical protein n=1 Tax=Enterocloster clostridioformis TaxID=1531 RepID=UPI00267550C2|nr:hypothetical protein [Enterocloster clostridioformis]
MMVEFNIPHGKMRIHAEGFFRDAGRMQIQRMLKYLSLSRPDEGQVREIRGWLEEQIRREKTEEARGSKASCKLVEKYGCILGYVDKILGGNDGGS